MSETPRAMPPPRGVVLDLWNTLAHDTSGRNPFLELGRILGVDGRPDWLKVVAGAMMRAPLPGIERALDRLEAAFSVRLEPPARAEVLRLWSRAESSAALFPDVLPVLGRLREAGYRLALLSNTQSFGLDGVLVPALRRLLHTIHLSCHTGHLKPEEEAFRGVVHDLGLEPSEALMVGDHHREDILGARAAGLQARLIRRGGTSLSHRETERAEPALASLGELALELGVSGEGLAEGVPDR